MKKYFTNSVETVLLTREHDKMLNTADNTNMYRYFSYMEFLFYAYAFPNPNIDRFYLEKNKNKYSGCWKLADISDIKYSNKHWQVMRLPEVTVFLYAAYLDTRQNSIQINSIQNSFSIELCFQLSESWLLWERRKYRKGNKKNHFNFT